MQIQNNGYKLINNPFFYVNSTVTYPPFKNGYYMEEFFLLFMIFTNQTKDKEGRIYIPALWTNFQIEDWFQIKKNDMQIALDSFIRDNPCKEGYFTIVQHDDGPMLKLPSNTLVYGACSGHIPLPLIYEDNKNTLENYKNQNTKFFKDKSILCSFVGTTTHRIRRECLEKLNNKKGFKFITKDSWSSTVESDLQDIYMKTTLDSKFALAPRGYGRSSFRFFEIFKLGSIPIYIWDDIEWLPYMDIIDYNKICISIHESEIDDLPEILEKITEEKYNIMINEYEKIKGIFDLDSICKYISDPKKSSLDINNTQLLKELIVKDYPDKISLCITTMDRFDDFLSKSIDFYIEYMQNGLIDEIIISDENGNDYEKLMDKYSGILPEYPNIKIYKNDKVLGVFKNKLKACSYASNKYIALIDSDNFADIHYFEAANTYIESNKHTLSKFAILSPSRSINHNLAPNLNYKEYSNKIITKKNIKDLIDDIKFQVLLNTGNYIISKTIIDNIKYDDNDELLSVMSGCDVVYFNLLAFMLIPDLEMRILENMEYYHTEHDNGEFNKRNNYCDLIRDYLIIPKYRSMS